MNKKELSERDICTKFITPALKQAGWDEMTQIRCEHLVGKPYMGEFCYLIARDPEMDHMSVVDHPADKRCRVVSFSENGVTRNRMTWRVEPAQPNPD